MIEFFYSLFLLSGLIKFFLNFCFRDPLFIDFTLFCAIILMVAYAINFGKNLFGGNRFYILRESKSIVFTVLAFYMWMIVTLIYTHSPDYCYTKVFRFLTIFVSIVFPFVYSRFSPERFFNLFSYSGSILIFIYSALLPNLYSGFLIRAENREFVEKYLDIGYLAGIMILVLAFACPKIKRLNKIILVIINLWALVISSARGPIVFLVFVLAIRFFVNLIIFFLKSRKFKIKKIFNVVPGLSLFGGFVYFFVHDYLALIERSVKRLVLMSDVQSSAVAKRFSQILFSFDNIFENVPNFLFGLGIGSFGVLYDGLDVRNYPHNIILELWFELGFIGIILFLSVLFIYFNKIRFNFNFLLIYIYLILNSMKSSSLVDSRIMFGILSVLFFCNVLVKRYNKDEGNVQAQFKNEI